MAIFQVAIPDTVNVEIGKRTVQLITDYDLWEIIVALIIISILLMWLGGLIYWFLKRKHIKSDTKKLISEAEKNAVEKAEKQIQLIEKYQQYRSKYIENSRCLAISLRSVLEFMRVDNIPEFEKYREESLNIFYADFIQSFTNYFEIIISTFSKKEKYDFIETEVVPFINTICDYLNVINLDAILKKINRSPAKLKNTTLLFIIRKSQNTIPWYKYRTKKEFQKVIDNLNKFIDAT